MKKNILINIAFYKYQANGNDFIIVEEEKTQDLFSLLQKNAYFICDRHKSVGADGILLIKKVGQIINLRVINADGSEAKNCGNGLRCVAQWFFDNNLSKIQVQILLAKIIYVAQKEKEQVLIGIYECKIKEYQQDLLTNISTYEANVKNPHLIWIFNKKPNLQKYLKFLKNNLPDFSSYNHNFVWFEKDKIYAEVFERGVGFTQSCGSGAIASACALVVFEKITSNSIQINQPGGSLNIVIKSKKNNKFLTEQIGVAKKSFHGFLVID